MNYNYYPGCTLSTKAKQLDYWARAAAKTIGINLVEQAQWQCCGAVYPLATDEIATRLPAVRSLALAKESDGKLVTLCSACHHVLKRVNADMQQKSDLSLKVNNYLQLPQPYQGETRVIHYLELLRDVVGFENLKKAVKNPLKNRKIAAYYGCMLLRPQSVMQFDNPENPKILEDFIKAIGAEPIIYDYRNECCGGYITLEDRSVATSMVNKIVAAAKRQGALEIISACPLCTYNLENNCSLADKLPVAYFTELLAEALGIKG